LQTDIRSRELFTMLPETQAMLKKVIRAGSMSKRLYWVLQVQVVQVKARW
jgi:hypothetical protein